MTHNAPEWPEKMITGAEAFAIVADHKMQMQVSHTGEHDARGPGLAVMSLVCREERSIVTDGEVTWTGLCAISMHHHLPTLGDVPGFTVQEVVSAVLLHRVNYHGEVLAGVRS